MQWRELTRDELQQRLPEAIVVVPLGSTEQHGPHLPTWTDALIVETVTTQAVERAQPDSVRALLVAPTIAIGASDHHLPFSGTLSLSVETLLAVLVDIARSVAACGGRRMALINGHGGNRGVCAAAAAAASSRYHVATAYADYSRLAPPKGPYAPSVANHAGQYETALIQAIRPDLVRTRPTRHPIPAWPSVDGFELHTEASWQEIAGYTDDPALASAADGALWRDAIVAALSDRLIELGTTL
jgi:creatinine amidohydrolase